MHGTAEPRIYRWELRWGWRGGGRAVGDRPRRPWRRGSRPGSPVRLARRRRDSCSTRAARPNAWNGRTSLAGYLRHGRGAAGWPTERFGDQVDRPLGAAEHRSERSRVFVSEKRRPQQRGRAAGAPKIRLASPAAPLRFITSLLKPAVLARRRPPA